jgi:hypothetical protein
MTCTICRRRAIYAGMFIADKPERFGGRVHLVQLCGKCQRKGKRYWTARVEAELLRGATGRN